MADGRKIFLSGAWHASRPPFRSHAPSEQRMPRRLANGSLYGRPLPITPMHSQRQGSVAMCSQPLHTNRAWLRDWAHHFQSHTHILTYLHLQGPHIDDLFTAERDNRLKFNERLAERSSSITGRAPLQRFDMPMVTWREYYPAPTAQYYVRSTPMQINSVC